MAKARPSKGRRYPGVGKPKSQRAKRPSAGSAKRVKARRSAPERAVAKAQVSRPRVRKGQRAIVVRAEGTVRSRQPAQVALPAPVIPETPPPLPAPIASFTF